MIENTVPLPKGLALLGLLVGVISVCVIANGKFTETQNGNVMALYVLGDSSVDCGDNTMLYPLIHHNLSLHPCNGSDTTLLPYLLGSYYFLILYTFLKPCFIHCYLSWNYMHSWFLLPSYLLLQDYIFFYFFQSARLSTMINFFQFIVIVKNHV